MKFQNNFLIQFEIILFSIKFQNNDFIKQFFILHVRMEIQIL